MSNITLNHVSFVMCQKWIFEILSLEQNGEHFSKTVFSADFKYVIKIPENVVFGHDKDNMVI